MMEKLLRICDSCLKIDVSLGENQWMPRGANPELYDSFIKRFKEKVTGTVCSKNCLDNYLKLSEKEQIKINKEREKRLSKEYET